MERTDNIIDWTVANWITVVLMVLLAFAAYGLLATLAAKMGIGKGSSNASA